MTESLLPFLTNQTYTMMGDQSKTERLRMIDEAVFDHGYRTVRNGSNRDIVTYENIADPTQKIISHRGTDTSGKKTTKEVTADIALALGLQGHDKEFKKRTTRTKNIVKKYPESSFKLTGHSFGGSSATHAITKSPGLRERIDTVDTYNAGFTPLFTEALKGGEKTKKNLKKRVTHHRVKGDVVSQGIILNKPVGKIKEYSLAKDIHGSVDHNNLTSKQGQIHSLLNFY